MLSVTNKPFMLSIVMPSVDMLNVVAPQKLATNKHSSLDEQKKTNVTTLHFAAMLLKFVLYVTDSGSGVN